MAFSTRYASVGLISCYLAIGLAGSSAAQTVTVLSCTTTKVTTSGTATGSTSTIGAWTIESSTGTGGSKLGSAPLSVSVSGAVQYSYKWVLKWVPSGGSGAPGPSTSINFGIRDSIDVSCLTMCSSPDSGTGGSSSVSDSLGFPGDLVSCSPGTGLQEASYSTPSGTWTNGVNVNVTGETWTLETDGSYETTITLADVMSQSGTGAVSMGVGGGRRASVQVVEGMTGEVTLLSVGSVNFTPWM